MLKISSIIIAKNEEVNIARCIESQLGCIDEIIILVDEESVDKTLDIVGSFPQVKYRVVRWLGFSRTKQYALELSSNDWILWVDADEAIREELQEELINFKNSQPEYSAYSIARRAYFLGKWIKHSGWYPTRVTRLFNKKKVKFSDNEVHEHLVFDGEIGKLKHDLDHFTDPSIQHYFEKFNRYTTLAANDLMKKEKNILLSDILIRPVFIFIKMYFIKLGFLDGIEGFILAVFSSSYVFTKYCKFWELKRESRV